jgi:WD40 repeat protein
LETGESLWQHKSGGEGLADVAFHPQGSEVAFCSWYRGEDSVRGLVAVFNADSGELTWKTDFGVKPIVSVRYNSDGSRLAVGTWDGIIGVWDTAIRSEPHVLDFRDIAAYSAIDEISFNGDGSRIAAASKSGLLRVWNLNSYKIEQDLRRLSSAAFSVVFATDSRLLSGDSDGALAVWDPQTGQLIDRLLGHENRIVSVAVHPGGNEFATASADHTIRFWGLDHLGGLDSPKKSEFVYGFTVSDDGQYLALAGQSPPDITCCLTSSAQPGKTFGGLVGSVNYLDFGPAALLAGGNWKGDVAIWDVQSGREVMRMESTEHGGMQQCAFSSDGRWLAVATNKNQVAIFDASAGKLTKLVMLEKGCWGLDFSRDHRFLAVGDGHGDIHLIATGEWQTSKVLLGHGGLVYGVKFSPDGTLIASGDENGRLTLYDLERGAERFSVVGHSQRIWSVSFCRDGSRLAAGGADRRATIWDVTTGQMVANLAGFDEAVYNVVFAPDSDDLYVNETRHQRRFVVPPILQPANQ